MYDSIFALAATLFGVIIGSFLNALSFRFNTGKSIVHGRSACMRCGHTLTALDLIPVFSYAMLRGRCRYCHTHISSQYPLVEVLGGALSLGVYLNTYTPLMFALWFFVWTLILFICIYDLKHTVIPMSCSLLLMVLSLCVVVFSGPTVIAFLAGPALAAPLLLISLLSEGTWMGWGDGLFELSLGWLLGIVSGIGALMLAVWSGALIGLGLIVFAQYVKPKGSRGFTMKSELPFAPFLALGAAAVYFLHVDLFSTLHVIW
ncbi:MAG TPA: prepilin peptidase [Candidatus Paceibacterota bacterium]|nr:prepilin peptidase [Candidatus Paceibacterota bacterium]